MVNIRHHLVECGLWYLEGRIASVTLRWRQNGRDSVSNHQPHDCLFNRLFRRRSKKTSKLRVTGLCVGNSPGPVNSPHKGPVARKMFPFDDVIMHSRSFSSNTTSHEQLFGREVMGRHYKRFPHYWALCKGNPSITGGIASQKASNEEPEQAVQQLV